MKRTECDKCGELIPQPDTATTATGATTYWISVGDLAQRRYRGPYHFTTNGRSFDLCSPRCLRKWAKAQEAQ